MGIEEKSKKSSSKVPLYPCIDSRALATRPFCGLLVPPDVLDKVFSQPTIPGGRRLRPGKVTKDKTNSKVWSCWLCNKQNDRARESCDSCARPRVPDWLRLVDGEEVTHGSFIRVKRVGTYYLGLITQINYRTKEIEAFLVKEPKQVNNNEALNATGEQQVNKQHVEMNGKAPTTTTDKAGRQKGMVQASEYPTKVVLAAAEVLRGNVQVLWSRGKASEEHRELALSLCHFLLCGNCGNVSKLSNGRAVLDSDAEQADKAGKLRALQVKLGPLENQVRFLSRKWRQNKTGYVELGEATKELEALRKSITALQAELAPFQFWCSHCAWNWPDSRPSYIV